MEPGCRCFFVPSSINALPKTEASKLKDPKSPTCLLGVCGGGQRGLHHQEWEHPELE